MTTWLHLNSGPFDDEYVAAEGDTFYVVRSVPAPLQNGAPPTPVVHALRGTYVARRDAHGELVPHNLEFAEADWQGWDS